ncbi:type II toxin-antitoxin system VapC family toxin [Sphingomonas rubra]|uniref:Ribonuclease VapC n=1 Tax=Sphingomonas rubra TaxID=634430 RepID=A0A1I5SRK6_9SPHN|nr:type II toxin-antitoxin system VapC family toxin [Sphingomonas rubra]SFP73373.1 Uncharacterized protein, contains PIN domain [Sphingomonas rubra]
MIVDTSALFAILLHEPEGLRFRSLIAKAHTPRISAGSVVELQAVLTRRFNGELDDEADELLAASRLVIVPVTGDQALIGREAYRRYGIGTGHRANLNFGDCFAYALARATGEPLLFKGDDFTHTDVPRVIG